MAETKASVKRINLEEIEDRIRTIGILTSGGDRSEEHTSELQSQR